MISSRPTKEPVETGTCRSSQSIHYEDRVFHLRNPVEMTVAFDDGMWTITCESLGLSGYGYSYDEAVQSFEADFGDCWDCIAMEDDEQLAADALDLKRKLLEAVETVESSA